MIPSAYGTTPGTILPSNYGLLSSVGGMSGGMAGGLSGGMYGGMYGGTYGGVGSPYTVCPSPRLSMLPPNDKAEDKKEAKKEEKAPKAVINITTTGWEQPIEDMKETMKELEQEMGMPAVRRVSNLQKSELEKCLNNTKKMQEQLDALKAKEREEQQQVNAKIAELTAERWRLQAQINDTKKTAADKVKVLEKEKEVLQQESKVKLAEVALKGNALAAAKVATRSEKKEQWDEFVNSADAPLMIGAAAAAAPAAAEEAAPEEAAPAE
jgi:hypothetical protein|eukprot:CAMPEP_0174294466 /NCGR_PEP_ID=MMETSP0809-20121228/41726_1 /TAXON_ID=73025 ORGANISM="Eutreptiella gymnastica-like, Strain CCMP1594" /NCGR_SAMPLE_ID=MMETSP0809 /ASSEMBLY_ACC=CAM_ASM_000658 /LENGTH=266 /DNA_ID=CAMNT_0015395937 /DNA_START=261 /DNA_END=1061 /DNA_ORIENTATION=+